MKSVLDTLAGVDEAEAEMATSLLDDDTDSIDVAAKQVELIRKEREILALQETITKKKLDATKRSNPPQRKGTMV
jgi:hypothetical protein